MLSLLRFGVAPLYALVSGLEGAFYGVLACESTCAIVIRGQRLTVGTRLNENFLFMVPAD